MKEKYKLYPEPRDYKYYTIVNKQIRGTDDINKLKYVYDLSCGDFISKQLSIFNVRTAQSKTNVFTLMKPLYAIDKDTIPLGFMEYVYITCLTEFQMKLALSLGTVTNSKYNCQYQMRGIMALRLLYRQRKLDYLNSVEKFLYWYWGNCSIIEGL